MTLHRAVARAVELALPEHGDLSEVIAVSDHHLSDDLLDLSLPNPPLIDVQIYDEPAVRVSSTIPADLVSDGGVQIARDRVGTSVPVLNGIEPHAARLSVFLPELAATMSASHFDFDGALADPDKAVRPLVATIGEANLIGADPHCELGEHVSIVQELELGLDEEVRGSVAKAEQPLRAVECSHRLPAPQLNACGFYLFRRECEPSWDRFVVLKIEIVREWVRFTDLVDPFVREIVCHGTTQVGDYGELWGR